MTILKKGDPAPDFVLNNQFDRPVKLSDFAGKKILLYFFPKANTSGCTAQGCCVQDAQSYLRSENIVSIGVSPNLPAENLIFAQKYNFDFLFLSDPAHDVSMLYGVWQQKKLYNHTYMGVVRSVFLINEQQTIELSHYKVSPRKTVQLIQAALTENQGK